MITLLVDEAYAFDYLSILHIKKEKNKNIESTWRQCFSYIEKQIGQRKMQEIISSGEYENLIKANQITFDAVEEARHADCSKESQITAKEVDNANMLRYQRKLELQAKFFNNTLTEIKT